MIVVNGLLDYTKRWELPTVYLFTGNPVIRNDGGLVMGRGAARMIRDHYSGIDRKLGQRVRARKKDQHLVFIQVDEHPIYPESQYLGWFQVKDHWAEPAKIELIRAAANELATIANAHTDHLFHMNFPGVGNGKLTEDEVRGAIEFLPNNVLIYR